MTAEKWLSIDEAAHLLGVSRGAIHRYVRIGKLQAYKTTVRGRTMFRLQDVEELSKPRPVDGEGKEAA